MKLPSKITSFKESSISNFSKILEIVKTTNITAFALYNIIKDNFNSLTEFIDTLDCLFSLRKIELLNNEGVIKYVE